MATLFPSTQPGVIIHSDRKHFSFFLAFISELWANCDLDTRLSHTCQNATLFSALLATASRRDGSALSSNSNKTDMTAKPTTSDRSMTTISFAPAMRSNRGIGTNGAYSFVHTTHDSSAQNPPKIQPGNRPWAVSRPSGRQPNAKSHWRRYLVRVPLPQTLPITHDLPTHSAIPLASSSFFPVCQCQARLAVYLSRD
ncbi:hypothetical protein CABS02_09934 [Colletotrichum abscissum]|uniref:Uncharacterized protein n=1 Tax=Colletotrichum abscissum TaxID=1671311 RepID=A0A9P9X9R4_9PEZI|nr:hypothetical protein CABS02_09934 [Colletotrichum abscissum]